MARVVISVSAGLRRHAAEGCAVGREALVDEVVVPEPTGISSLDGLATGLKALRRRSGLSYAQLSQAVARLPRDPSRAAALPESTVSDILRTGRVNKPALLAFLTACHVSDADIMHWVAAWERARTADFDRPTGAQRCVP